MKMHDTADNPGRSRSFDSSTSFPHEENDVDASMDQLRVESEDIPESPKGTIDPFFMSLLQSMRPSRCLAPAADLVHGCTTVAYKSCTGTARDELDSQIPGLLKEVRGGGKLRTVALQKLYRSTDREHRRNRIPIVCTTKYKTIQTLVTAIGENVPHSDRRQALLILNNLCIPNENKAAILFGEPAEHLVTALLYILRNRLAESHLAAVTLLNLSYLQDDHARNMLFTYVPIQDENQEGAETYSYQLPIDNPISLIRTLEATLKEFVAYVPQKMVNSVEQQCCRWIMNVLRNLVTVNEIAISVGTRSTIPAIAAECLSHADTTTLGQWTRDSLEDACLMLLVHVCRFDECLEVLQRNETLNAQVVAVCENLEASAVGIHATRAAALLERFEDTTASTRSVGYSV